MAATNHDVGQRPESHDDVEPALQGALDVLGLVSLLRWLRGVDRDGRLTLTSGAWSGEICLRRGQVVAAIFGEDRGRAALEAILLVLPQARFTFTQAAVAEPRDDDLGLDVDDLPVPDVTLAELGLDPCLVGPTTVPRPVRVGDDDQPQPTADLVLPLGTLHTLLAVDGVRSIQQLSNGQRVAQVLFDLATLSKLGLVALPVEDDQAG